MQKPLPPYGDIVSSFLKFNVKSSIYIYCGKKAWEDAKASIESAIPCLYIPFKKNPNDYFWPVKNGRFILFDTGGLTLIELKKICLSIIDGGARSVFMYTEIAPFALFENKEIL